MIVFLNNDMEILSSQMEASYKINMMRNGQGTGEFLLTKAPPASSTHVMFYRNEVLIYRGVIRTFNASTYRLATDEYWYYYWCRHAYMFEDGLESPENYYPLGDLHDMLYVTTLWRVPPINFYKDETLFISEYTTYPCSQITLTHDTLAKQVKISDEADNDIIITLANIFFNDDVPGNNAYIFDDVFGFVSELDSNGTKFLLDTGKAFIINENKDIEIEQAIGYRLYDTDETLPLGYYSWDADTETTVVLSGFANNIVRMDYSSEAISDELIAKGLVLDPPGPTPQEILNRVLYNEYKNQDKPTIDFTYTDVDYILANKILPGVEVLYKLNNAIKKTVISNIVITEGSSCVISIGTTKKYFSDYIKGKL